MNIDKIIRKLSKFGDVHVCKAGLVFTVFITGKNLDSTDTFMAIHEIVKDVKDKYKNIEVLKNDSNFYLMVLKPIDQ